MAYPNLALRSTRNGLISHYIVAGSKNPLSSDMGSVNSANESVSDSDDASDNDSDVIAKDADTPDNEDSGSSSRWIILLGVGVLIAGGAAFLFIRKRRE